MTGPADNQPARAQMPADVDAPDKVLYGLTFRQLALLAIAALLLAGGWHSLHRIVPAPLLLVAGVAVGGLGFAVAVGRRDGQPLDIWLLHAIRYQRAPHALSTIDTAAPLPDWVTPPPTRTVLPAPLRLPADAIGDDGDIDLGAGGRAAIVAASTVNLALRTGDEQAALIDTLGRWLNSLTDPTQIVVSAQPVDLTSKADTLTAHAPGLPHPALSAACVEHAAFLSELAGRRDPLHRQVLITTRIPAGGSRQALRRADDTVRALAGLAVTARTLDGPAATAALAGCADPYRPPRRGTPAAPHTTITAAAVPGQERNDQ
jgi:hypothetical protein